MDAARRLLGRLDAIGASLARQGDALALLGLGSVGVETGRIDAWSDLDFFAIVKPGSKRRYIDDLGWLSDVTPLAWAFRNTVDGFKILFDDGIYGEFAVFEPDELAAIPFAEGRVVWKAEGVDDAIRVPVRGPAPRSAPDEAWCVGEALTCLYVGLCRYLRGERLSAQRLVQQHAVDRIVELAALYEPASAGGSDPYSLDRRFESRHPQTAAGLAGYVQGYERTPESARAILELLRARWSVNRAMAERVEALIDAAKAAR